MRDPLSLLNLRLDKYESALHTSRGLDERPTWETIGDHKRYGR